VLTKTTLLKQQAEVTSLGGRVFRALRSWGYRSSGAVVALSDALTTDLRQAGIPQERILRIPNGVDTTLFRPATSAERSEARRRFGLPEQALVVSSCGMLIPRKNPILLVRAALRMRERPVHLVLAGPFGGDPPYEAELRRLIGECPPDVQVKLPGGLSPEEVARLLQASDVFALTSRAEGMPNSLLEGMAAGLPSVVTDIPGSRDVLEQGGGRLLPPDDPDALAAQLDAYARDAGLRERDGKRAREIIEAQYGIDAVTERYLRAYSALLSGRPLGAVG
jgi:glycosyltransferase involved in cell wall biosynthesis